MEFWWQVPDGREWLALCARCCMVMRKHKVEALRITNAEPQDVAVCYAHGTVIHIDYRSPA